MKTKIVTSIIAVLFSVASYAQTSYGDVKVDGSKAATAEHIAALAAGLREKKVSMELNDVTFTGKVDEVCQAKGCWMTTTLSNGEVMTIKFKDYAFFMPKDCQGKEFTAHGKMFIKTTSVAELKHLAEDAGKSKKEIKKIKQPKQEIRFEADGVTM